MGRRLFVAMGGLRVGFCAGEQKMWWVDLGLSVRLEGLIENSWARVL